MDPQPAFDPGRRHWGTHCPYLTTCCCAFLLLQGMLVISCEVRLTAGGQSLEAKKTQMANAVTAVPLLPALGGVLALLEADQGQLAQQQPRF